MNNVIKYYLTDSSKKEILSGDGWFWETFEDEYSILTHNRNLAQSWNSKEDLLKEVEKRKISKDYKIALFKDDTFLEFLNY